MAITYMTEEGYKKLMEEIAYLENVKRPEISRAIGEASVPAKRAAAHWAAAPRQRGARNARNENFSVERLGGECTFYRRE